MYFPFFGYKAQPGFVAFAELADAFLDEEEPGQLLGLGVWELAEDVVRSEEHTSELQSLMRISYAVFCLKKKKDRHHNIHYTKLPPELTYTFCRLIGKTTHPYIHTL